LALEHSARLSDAFILALEDKSILLEVALNIILFIVNILFIDINSNNK